MIYFTSLSDTPSSIARDLLGGVDYGDTLADSIRSINKNSMAARSQLGSYYAPNRPIWIPGFSSMPEYGPIIERIINRLDTLPSNSRMQLAMAMSRGQDLNPMMGASKVVQKNNQDNADKAGFITASLAGKGVIETTSRAVERTARQAEKFSASMARLNETTKQALDAHRLHGSSSDIFKTARSALHSQHKEATNILNKESTLFTRKLSARTRKHIKSAKTEFIRAKKKGIMISDLDDVKRIENIAKYGKRIGKGFFAFSVALGVDEVYETYQNGGDTFVAASGVGAEILGTAIASGAMMLMFTPAGWAALAATAVVEGLFLVGVGELSKTFGEEAAKGVEECYEWVKEKLCHLL